ncbi:MAG: hypothetical protein ACYDHN_08205 [Solirubrobacteraceae bacterium]
MRSSVSEASALLESEDGKSDAWFELRSRLVQHCERLGSAVYCLNEWPEPNDACADVDDSSKYGEYRRNIFKGEAQVCGDRTD